MLRFAPSPNGPLHKGHALSALANERMAGALRKPLRLRLEDIDRTRCRPEYERAIEEDLAWLGIAREAPVTRQSAHFARYDDALERLRLEGLLVPSVLTRKEIAAVAAERCVPRDPDGAPIVLDEAQIIGAAQHRHRLDAGTPTALRLDMARALSRTGPLTMKTVDAFGRSSGEWPVEPARWGNVVLARKEIPTSYHLSVVVDDAAEGITHVVRGQDLEAATAVHRVLQTLLGLPAPLYHHHALVLGPDGRKLSKSNGAQSLAALREAGVTATDLRRELEAFLSEHPAAPA